MSDPNLFARQIVSARSSLLLTLPALGLMAALHLPFLEGYGFFRDELYYLACAARPSFGYVDHAPLSIWVLRAWVALFGDSLVSVRLLALTTGMLCAGIGAFLARELGVGRLGIAIAALACVLSPQFMGQSHLYSMNNADIFLWSVVLLCYLRMVRSGRRSLWLLLGLLIGLAALNKHSSLFFAASLLVGIVLGPARSDLRTPFPYLGALVALLVFSPNLVWQVQHGFPTLEFARNAALHKNVRMSPPAFLWYQMLELGLANVLLWVAGVVAAVRGRLTAEVRPIAVGFLALLGGALLFGAKSYYLGPYYPALFALGICYWERRSRADVRLAAWLQRTPRFGWLPAPRIRRVAAIGFVCLLLFVGIASAPLAIPMMSVDRLLAYSKRLGLGPAQNERAHATALPQHFADAHGWQNLATSVDRIVASLSGPMDETLIVTANYGQAAALERFSKSGLPVTSVHNSYAIWDIPQPDRIRRILAVGFPAEAPESVRAAFDSIERIAEHRCAYCAAPEQAVVVSLWQGPKQPVLTLRKRAKSYQ